ncbi:MAG TPA: sporulation membrane protein YtaF [Firmicutes bacterium]|jgi:putative sporulation protein YtaF|nr:sporulation membrane protein YtaF [Bacillota bacterium]
MLISIFILAISLSLDALGVGVVYGLKKIKIPLVSKLIISIFSVIYAGLALVIGKSLSSVLSPFLGKLIGNIILGVMGVWIIIQALFKEAATSSPDATLWKIAIKSLGITIQVIRDPLEFDIDKSGAIDTPESLLLGFALSVDAIGVGIGSALTGFYSPLIPFAVGLFQMFFLYIGTYFGETAAIFSRMNPKMLSLLPGVLLICLAIIRIY